MPEEAHTNTNIGSLCQRIAEAADHRDRTEVELDNAQEKLDMLIVPVRRNIFRLLQNLTGSQPEITASSDGLTYSYSRVGDEDHVRRQAAAFQSVKDKLQKLGIPFQPTEGGFGAIGGPTRIGLEMTVNGSTIDAIMKAVVDKRLQEKPQGERGKAVRDLITQQVQDELLDGVVKEAAAER